MLKDDLSSTLMPGSLPLGHVTQSPTGLESLQGWGVHNLSGQAKKELVPRVSSRSEKHLIGCRFNSD